MDKDIETIGNIISTVTDSIIQNKALENTEREHTKKLNLWIAGLSTGLELFILNKISNSDMKGFETFLLFVSGIAFLYNAFIGLYLNKIMIGVNNLEIANQRRFIHQKMQMIGILHSNQNKEITDDFHSGELILKMQNLDYFPTAKKEREIIRTAKLINHLSVKYTTIALIIQFTATAILYILH